MKKSLMILVFFSASAISCSFGPSQSDLDYRCAVPAPTIAGIVDSNGAPIVRAVSRIRHRIPKIGDLFRSQIPTIGNHDILGLMVVVVAPNPIAGQTEDERPAKFESWTVTDTSKAVRDKAAMMQNAIDKIQGKYELDVIVLCQQAAASCNELAGGENKDSAIADINRRLLSQIGYLDMMRKRDILNVH